MSLTPSVLDRPTPPEPDQPTPSGRAGLRAARAAAKAERRRMLLRRVGLPVLAVLVVVALVMGVVHLLAGRGGGGGAASAAAARSQETLLIQVTGEGRTATDAVLTGRDTDGKGATALLLPTGLITDAPGVGAVPFGETTRLPDPATAGEALSDQLGVLVDGVWRLDQNALARLVDGVGGVTVDVGTDVQGPDGSVVVARGDKQQLSGEQAAAYASVLGSKEVEQVRSARFADVLRALLVKLPTDSGQVKDLVASLGGDAASTWDAQRVADHLQVLAAQQRDGGLDVQSLPVKPIDSGSDSSTFRLDSDAATAMVKDEFAGSQPPKASGVEVRALVENGVGTPGLVEKARARLVAARLAFVNGGNASSFDHDRSVVVISDDTTKSRAQGAAVAAALGLPASAVEVSDRGQSVADVVVVLGKDFSG